MIDKLKSLARSRRFWAAALTSVLLLVAEEIGVDKETATKITGLVAAWIVGDSLQKTE